ncbi:MAG: alpha/beta fold hydrolase [Salinibacter sp.]
MRRFPAPSAAALLLAGMVLAGLAGPAVGQPSLRRADLGRCTLENGNVIEDCTIGYRTAGTLNATRSNAVLVPTWFSGTSADLTGQLGPGGLVDTSRYFVVLVDALGNGVSASPSTSTAQPDSAFPVFSVRDMVDTQRRLLTEPLNIDSLHAVMGLSMGGMQTFTWMTRYPGFMDKAVPLTGTPRLTPQGRLLWRAELRAFRVACAGSAGRRQAMRTIAAIHSLHLQTPRRLATMDSTAFRNFVEQQRAGVLDFDPYDWAWQLKAMLRHDVTDAFGGSIDAAAAAVEAEVLVVTVRQDHMVNPLPAQRFAEARGAEQLVLDTPCGHLGLGCKADTVATTVRRFLRSN